MRIGVDARGFVESRTGIEEYSYQLYKAIGEIGDSDAVCYAKKGPLAVPCNRFQSRIVPQRGLFGALRWHGRLAAEAAGDRLDVFHGPLFTLPPLANVPCVVTVHDLAFMKFPEQRLRLHNLYFTRLFKQSLRRASGVIAVSRQTKNDLCALCGVAESNVVVIYEAASQAFRRVEDPFELERIRKKHNLPDAYILFVGTLSPRKNVEGLLRAFHAVREDISHMLVVVGRKGWKFRSIFKLVEDLGLGGRVQFLGEVHTGELPALYTMADFLALPSFYEGFGLPAVEAMACGTPVMISNVSSLPEVGGEAALYCNPDSVESIAEGLRRLATDRQLRLHYSELALAQAAMFSWHKTALQTLDYFKRVVDSR